jgi:hypothetical protein
VAWAELEDSTQLLLRFGSGCFFAGVLVLIYWHLWPYFFLDSLSCCTAAKAEYTIFSMGKPPGRRPSFSSQIPSLDLHGALVDEVFDLMDRFLRGAEANGADRVRIIHGKGTGKVKDKALEYCRLSGHVPKPDTGDGIFTNPGSFLLYL